MSLMFLYPFILETTININLKIKTNIFKKAAVVLRSKLTGRQQFYSESVSHFFNPLMPYVSLGDTTQISELSKNIEEILKVLE